METLTHVERLGANDSGLLSFGVEPLGGIFVEKGRVCWVAARGLQRRLRDLLLAYSSIDRAALESVCTRCRREGLLLGQTLVAEGLLQAGELELALRRHSAESLLHLCESVRPTRWTVHAGRGYSPAFTFRAVDLFFDAVALLYPEARRRADDELAAFVAPGRRGAAFLPSEGAREPLPIADFGSSLLETLRALGRVALTLSDTVRELGSESAFSLSTTLAGDGTLAWRRGGLLFAVRCNDRTSLASATALHLAGA